MAMRVAPRTVVGVDPVGMTGGHVVVAAWDPDEGSLTVIDVLLGGGQCADPECGVWLYPSQVENGEAWIVTNVDDETGDVESSWFCVGHRPS